MNSYQIYIGRMKIPLHNTRILKNQNMTNKFKTVSLRTGPLALHPDQTSHIIRSRNSSKIPDRLQKCEKCSTTTLFRARNEIRNCNNYADSNGGKPPRHRRVPEEFRWTTSRRQNESIAKQSVGIWRMLVKNCAWLKAVRFTKTGRPGLEWITGCRKSKLSPLVIISEF